MALRFLVGMGLGGELPVASTLVSESVEAKERGKVVTLLESFLGCRLVSSCTNILFCYSAFSQSMGWRVALLLTALPAVYAIYIRWHLPDSPQFTVKVEAKKRSIFQNIRDVWSKKYARSTLMLWILWFTVVFSYYGMFLWLPRVNGRQRL